MLVMNDRPQGGAGFRRGRIELMFNRRGTTSDDLGMGEGMNEYHAGSPIRTHNIYQLKFTRDREELFDTIMRKTA